MATKSALPTTESALVMVSKSTLPATVSSLMATKSALPTSESALIAKKLKKNSQQPTDP